VDVSGGKTKRNRKIKQKKKVRTKKRKRAISFSAMRLGRTETEWVMNSGKKDLRGGEEPSRDVKNKTESKTSVL